MPWRRKKPVSARISATLLNRDKSVPARRTFCGHKWSSRSDFPNTAHSKKPKRSACNCLKPAAGRESGTPSTVVYKSCAATYMKQVSFKKEVGVMVNDLVFWLTVWLNFENVLLTFKWYVFMWQKCSMLTNYANFHFFNKWKCVSMPLLCYDISMNKTIFYTPPPSIMSFLIIYSCQFKFLSTFLKIWWGEHWNETIRALNDYLICC